MPKGAKKRDANVMKGKLENKVDNKTYTPATQAPMFSDVADDWLKSKVSIRENTREGYRGHIENHLKPQFKAYKINQLTFAVVERYMFAALKEGVTPPTLKKILTTLSGIMKYALKHRYVDSNPVREIERPTVERNGDQDVELVVLQPGRGTCGPSTG
jgi:site-specific recombinase XerC